MLPDHEVRKRLEKALEALDRIRRAAYNGPYNKTHRTLLTIIGISEDAITEARKPAAKTNGARRA